MNSIFYEFIKFNKHECLIRQVYCYTFNHGFSREFTIPYGTFYDAIKILPGTEYDQQDRIKYALLYCEFPEFLP